MITKKKRYHIVNFKSDFNSVLNRCGQFGRLQLRAHDDKQVSSIKNNLKEFGIEVVPHTEHLGKKK